jgi:hypothetical protein
MIDFEYELRDLGYRGMHFSDQTKDSINLYLFRGLMPGGHLEAQFAHDLERALYNADTHNRTVFWAIAMWIRNNAPDECQGSYDAVDAWCKDANGCRTKWVTWYALSHKEEPEDYSF